MLGKKHTVMLRDRKGVARIFQDHPNADIAETLALERAKEYIKQVPSAGPLSAWKIQKFISSDKSDEMDTI